MASNGNISHAEIWDDSALVESWNEALEEYKKYHSIKARGETVEDILIHLENQNTTTNDDTTVEDNGPPDQKTTGIKANHHERDMKSTHENPLIEMHIPAIPQHLIGQAHDESLKKLLMSWYYAGYYTGFYEGQHKDKSDVHAKP